MPARGVGRHGTSSDRGSCGLRIPTVRPSPYGRPSMLAARASIEWGGHAAGYTLQAPGRAPPRARRCSWGMSGRACSACGSSLHRLPAYQRAQHRDPAGNDYCHHFTWTGQARPRCAHLLQTVTAHRLGRASCGAQLTSRGVGVTVSNRGGHRTRGAEQLQPLGRMSRCAHKLLHPHAHAAGTRPFTCTWEDGIGAGCSAGSAAQLGRGGGQLVYPYMR